MNEGLVLLILLFVFFYLKRKKPAGEVKPLAKTTQTTQTTQEGEGASLSLEIYHRGKRLEASSPVDLVESSEPYELRAKVTNKTTRAGTPWPATLNIAMGVYANTTTLGGKAASYNFAAGETKTITLAFYVKAGQGGKTGIAWAAVSYKKDSTLHTIASKRIDIRTVAAPLKYAATIDVTV